MISKSTKKYILKPNNKYKCIITTIKVIHTNNNNNAFEYLCTNCKQESNVHLAHTMTEAIPLRIKHLLLFLWTFKIGYKLNFF